MYCLGTGDCFVLKFCAADGQPQFTMLIDCGSCVGEPADFAPYVRDLAEYVENTIDLLVVTHEHNDHVNGFAKCRDIFERIDIRQAWFAWTENPDDPDGQARDLHNKRQRMREGFEKALTQVSAAQTAIQAQAQQAPDFYRQPAQAALTAFVSGLKTLGDINLNQPEPAEPAAAAGKSLAGMRAIKAMLEAKKVPIKYLTPGTSQEVPQLPGVRFHVLGPPLDKQYIYKDGKEGRDVYKRNFAIGEGILAMNTFASLGQEPTEADLPFGAQYVLDPPGPDGQRRQEQLLDKLSEQAANLTDATEKQRLLNMKTYLASTDQLLGTYADAENQWRAIEHEWLYTAGSLAIRLNSHLNNTSLALAVEVGEEGPVLLLPGDAEYGSWESWHLLDKWGKPTKSGLPFVEDLLNRTVFYKVSHHLSYNGTALEKGIRMMNSPRLATMVTLDRTRISSQWKSTMPNHALLGELVKRCQGRCFIMNEAEIDAPPSAVLDPATLGPGVYETKPHTTGALYKQYTVQL